MVAVHVDSDARRGMSMPASVRDRAAAFMWDREINTVSRPSG